MYTTTNDTLDMIRDYLDGTLTAADAEAWAELQDFARNILTADPEAADLDAPHLLPEDYPLPPTRPLTDTERTVLRGMLP